MLPLLLLMTWHPQLLLSYKHSTLRSAWSAWRGRVASSSCPVVTCVHVPSAATTCPSVLSAELPSSPGSTSSLTDIKAQNQLHSPIQSSRHFVFSKYQIQTILHLDLSGICAIFIEYLFGDKKY